MTRAAAPTRSPRLTGTSFHQATGERYPSLRRDLDADVAVIGGGVTGAAVAWVFAEAGVRVAVMDARRISRGSTAASTALLMQEPDEDFTDLSRRNEARTSAADLAAQR
jgi:glycine/D-amino acid oxidase-like deaminating enzyme